jgi:hypothetical protein
MPAGLQKKSLTAKNAHLTFCGIPHLPMPLTKPLPRHLSARALESVRPMFPHYLFFRNRPSM